MKNKAKKGFTLIEILFSIALIAIIVVIGIQYMQGATEAALLADMKTDVRSAISEQEAAKINDGI